MNFYPSQSPVYINQHALDAFIRYAELEKPREACGCLISVDNQIAAIQPIQNISPQNNRFLMNPAELTAFVYEMEGSGNRYWSGVIHSHPTGSAEPSIEDVGQWHYPQLMYWIVSLQAQKTAAYLLDNQKFKPLEWKTVE
jgi:proteasome lid subunit RPN8/RPN11